MCGVPSVVYSDTGFADFIVLHKAGEVFSVYEPHVALDKLQAVISDKKDYVVSTELVEDIIGVEAFGKRMLVSLGQIITGSSPEYHYARPISGPVALHRVNNMKATTQKSSMRKTGLKWTVLYSLEKTLPAPLVTIGEKLLKRLGVI